MDWMTWYNALAKPTWTPSPSRIRLIWTILYPIIAVTFGFVFVQALRGKLPLNVALAQAGMGSPRWICPTCARTGYFLIFAIDEAFPCR